MGDDDDIMLNFGAFPTPKPSANSTSTTPVTTSKTSDRNQRFKNRLVEQRQRTKEYLQR